MCPDIKPLTGRHNRARHEALQHLEEWKSEQQLTNDLASASLSSKHG